MSNTVEAPAVTTTLTAHLATRNAADALDFYPKAFGAEVLHVMKLPDGRVMHACLSIGGATFFLVDEFPEHGGQSPQGLGGSPVTLHLQVSDSDAVYARAVEAGCRSVMPIQEMFWGDRYGIVVDPFGHKWSIATTVRQLTPEQMMEAMANMPGCGD